MNKKPMKTLKNVNETVQSFQCPIKAIWKPRIRSYQKLRSRLYDPNCKPLKAYSEQLSKFVEAEEATKTND